MNMEQLRGWMSFAQECERGAFLKDMIEKSVPPRSFWEEGWLPAADSGSFRQGGASPPAYVPAYDLFQSDTEYLIGLDVPGVAKSDLDLTIEGSRLTVRGSRCYPETGWTSVQTECIRGPFERTIELPQAPDGCQLSAKLENGVLWIRCPKQYRPQEKIPIR